MPILSKPEVFRALQYAKSLPESEGAKIIGRFKKDQPALYEMIFGGLAQAITRQDKGLGYLFMDLCFDILCVYQLTHGELPKHLVDYSWLCNKMASLQAEMLPPDNFKIESKTAVVQSPSRTTAGNSQSALQEYLDMATAEYTESGAAKQDASIAATNMLHAVIRIFDAIYNEPPATRH